MPIGKGFRNPTLVAFTDVAGFKHAMQRSSREALRILDMFYQRGYASLRRTSGQKDAKVEGIFISDCGVLFVRHNRAPIETQLEPLLEVIENLNRDLIRRSIMLSTSIAYGDSIYEPRGEFQGIAKHLIFGDAYLNAFLDNEVGKPKLEPGFCRIVVPSLSEEASKRLSSAFLTRKLRREEDENLYFYWMVQNSREIDTFRKRYKKATDKRDGSRYDLMKQALLKSCEAKRRR